MVKEDVIHIYNGILLSDKKNGIMPFAATWMDLEIKLDSERQISYVITYMWNLKKKDTNELICRTKTGAKTLKANLWLPKGTGWRA